MQPTSARSRFILAAVAASCVIALSLLLILHDGVRGFVLDPIVIAINGARTALRYMSQDLQWLIAVPVAFLFVIGYVGSRLPKSRRRPCASVPPRFPTEGPTMVLARTVAESVRYRHRRVRLSAELRDAAARALAHRDSLPLDEAEENLDTTEWTDDASVRAFLSPDQHRAGRHDTRRLHEQVERALTEIERMYREA